MAVNQVWAWRSHSKYWSRNLKSQNVLALQRQTLVWHLPFTTPSIANHSSCPTVLQLKCVSDSILNSFENHQPQKKKFPLSVMLLSFKTRIKWPLGRPQPQVFWGYFFNSCNIQGNVQAFRLTRLMTKTYMTFPAFSLRFVDLAV